MDACRRIVLKLAVDRKVVPGVPDVVVTGLLMNWVKFERDCNVGLVYWSSVCELETPFSVWDDDYD